MPGLANTKHEQFAQSVAKGISATVAYISAGYSKVGAVASASRLRSNAKVAARVQELKTANAANFVSVEIRQRSARVQVGQNLVDRLCRLVEARALEYADHPGGATGMVVKEYRGKHDQQEIWKFDAGVVSQINATLMQVAIEEGQWREKRESSDGHASSVLMARLEAGRQRIAEDHKKREAASRVSGTVLDNSKHEQFAQSVATGTSAAAAYTTAGYSEAGAAASASRLRSDPNVSARIEELETSIAEGVVEVDIRKRRARVQILENTLNRMLRLIDARAVEHADHPGGVTGLLVKDYRGKDAEQEIWKLDAALVSRINATMKQAAIEEGQWSEKREASGTLSISEITERLNAGRDRCAAEQRAREARAVADGVFGITLPNEDSPSAMCT